MAATIRALKSRELSVLLSEQNLRLACIVGKGRIRWQGDMEALETDEAARQQYLSV